MSLRIFRLLLAVGLGWTGAATGSAWIAGTAMAQAGSVAGLWLDDEGKGGIDIQPCGAQMCGRIVWLKEPLDPSGKPWADKLNPDQKKRAQPVCGLQVIGGLKPNNKGGWEDGWIYDPEEGKRYDVEISLKDANTLTVFGYMGVKLIGETMTWTRMAANTPRCG